MVVDGHLHLNGGLKVEGAGIDGVIRLGGARVGLRLQANEEDTARPTGGLVLDLGDATVGRLQLSPNFVTGDSRWLNVDRLVYTGLPMGATRAEWIHVLRDKTIDYSPQAWRHLADAFRSAGHDNDARRVLFAQQRDRADRTLRPSNRDGENRFRLWLQRCWLMVLRVTIGYGYQVGRALVWLAVIAMLAVVLGFAAGSLEYRGARIATAAAASAPHAMPCSSIEQAGMGLGIGLPLIKEATSDRCRIDTSNPRRPSTHGGWVAAPAPILDFCYALHRRLHQGHSCELRAFGTSCAASHERAAAPAFRGSRARCCTPTGPDNQRSSAAPSKRLAPDQGPAVCARENPGQPRR